MRRAGLSLAGAAVAVMSAGAQPQQPQQQQQTLVFRQEPAHEVVAMAIYSRTALVEDARCAVRWHYGVDGDSVLVDSLGPARIAGRDSTHVYPPFGRELCPGTQPLVHTHLLWMLTFANGGYVEPRMPSGCDYLIALRKGDPWDVIVDVTPITFAPFLYAATDTVREHYRCP